MKKAMRAVRAFLVTALPHDGPTSFLNCTRKVLVEPALATWILASPRPSAAMALRASETILLSDWCAAAGTSHSVPPLKSMP